jgi:hypothetical protein
MDKNYRKAAEAPKLADTLPEYEGKVVRIGTDGSAYYVCGKWSETLQSDLEWWETEKKRLKADMIEKMKVALAEARKNLPKMKKELTKLEIEAAEAKKMEDEFINRAGYLEAIRNKRIDFLPGIINQYLDNQKAMLENNIKDFSSKEKSKARRDFLKFAKGRRTRFNVRLRKYINYINRQMALDTKKLGVLSTNTETARNKVDNLNKRIGNAKGRIEAYPGKIRDYKRYLANYTPFMDRSVMEVYSSEIHPGETTIIIKGREAGPFWDCEEFNRWKKTGTLCRD